MTEQTTTLKRTLGSFRLWGIAVGLVISGEYFGWSYGWSQAGTLGFMIVALAIAAMYCAFIFSFTELTTAIPHAGGPFAYAYRAFGPTGGFIAGFATLIEFVFAPPAIAMAIGASLAAAEKTVALMGDGGAQLVGDMPLVGPPVIGDWIRQASPAVDDAAPAGQVASADAASTGQVSWEACRTSAMRRNDRFVSLGCQPRSTGSHSGFSWVTARYPRAPARSTAARTRPNTSPCSAAATRTSVLLRSRSLGSGADSSSEIRFQICPNTAPAAIPPSTLVARESGL